MSEKITDLEIEKYIDDFHFESFLREYEEKMLKALKLRYEKYPTEKNNQEWLELSNYVCKRAKTK
jgi:hypothetical protein